MNRVVIPVAILVMAACSSLPDAGNGIVALEVVQPDTLAFAVGQSDTLHAHALDIHGDTVASAIYWRTPDTAFASLDSVRGVLVGKSVGSVRIQARAGTLLSDILTLTVNPPDTTTTTGSLRQRP